MTRVLVVWEDKNFESLDVASKRLVRNLAPAPAAAVPVVLGHTTRGNGVFERYVETTWPKVQPRGLPIDPRPIDHLICVVDGDKLHDLLRGEVTRAPDAAAQVASWHLAAERTWQAYLRARCPADGPASSTVHGIVLRWAKESAALAGYDQAASRTALDLAEGDRANALLATCSPDPRNVPDAAFTDTFRRPLGCLRLLRPDRTLEKMSPEIDDAIKAFAKHQPALLRARVPDLARIADLVWTLHGATPTPPATT